MKIALLISRFYPIIGGGETYVYNLATYLAAHNHDVTVITGLCKNRNIVDFTFKLVEIPGLDDSSPNLSQVIPELHQHFSSTDYDVVHINNYMPYFLLTSSVQYNPRTRYVFTTHNTPEITKKIFSTFNNYESEKLFAARLLDNGPHCAIISLSKEFTQSINVLSTKKQLVFDIGHGVTTRPLIVAHEREAIRKRYGVGASDFFIISTARFVRRKNLKMVLESLAQLPSNFKLLMTGAAHPEGKETYQEVFNYIKKHQLVGSVIVPKKPLEFNELMDHYRAADMYVLTSFIEGFGLAVIEAMACRVPVIVTDVPGPREVVTNEVSGLLVPSGDSSALTKAIVRLSKDSDLRALLVQNGFDLVRKKYSLEASFQKHVDVYKKITEDC